MCYLLGPHWVCTSLVWRQQTFAPNVMSATRTRIWRGSQLEAGRKGCLSLPVTPFRGTYGEDGGLCGMTTAAHLDALDMSLLSCCVASHDGHQMPAMNASSLEEASGQSCVQCGVFSGGKCFYSWRCLWLSISSLWDGAAMLLARKVVYPSKPRIHRLAVKVQHESRWEA